MKLKTIFYVTLLVITFASCSKDDSTDIEPVVKETLKTYNDVEFALRDYTDDTNYGVFFSTETGKVYKQDEVDDTNGSKIDIVSFSNQVFSAFMSPHDPLANDNIPNATETIIQHIDSGITVEQFDAMEDDTLLKGLTIIDDNESVRTINVKEKIITFKNSKGKIGAIKMNLLNAERINVTIKVQL